MPCHQDKPKRDVAARPSFLPPWASNRCSSAAVLRGAGSPKNGECSRSGKEANPIAEIFDEMFTLMQDVETRSVALFEYLQEQGGATDEKLAPYLDRAASAADVRWRAARARMEHLLAPKPKSSTDVAEATVQRHVSIAAARKGKDTNSGGTKSPGENQQGTKPESKDLGKGPILSASRNGQARRTERREDGKRQARNQY